MSSNAYWPYTQYIVYVLKLDPFLSNVVDTTIFGTCLQSNKSTHGMSSVEPGEKTHRK